MEPSKVQTNINDGDFFQYTSCPGFDNSVYLVNPDIKFSDIPTAGVKSYMTFTADIVKDFFVSYAHITCKFNGFKLIDKQSELDTKYKAGGDYSLKKPFLGQYIPSGLVTGRLEGYNEVGEQIQCYEFSVYVRKNPNNTASTEFNLF